MKITHIFIILFIILLSGCDPTDSWDHNYLEDPIEDERYDEIANERNISGGEMLIGEMIDVLDILNDYYDGLYLISSGYYYELFTLSTIDQTYTLDMFPEEFNTLIEEMETFNLKDINGDLNQYVEKEENTYLIYKSTEHEYTIEVTTSRSYVLTVNTSTQRVYFDDTRVVNYSEAYTTFFNPARDNTNYHAYQMNDSLCIYRNNHSLENLNDTVSPVEFNIIMDSSYTCFHRDTNYLTHMEYYVQNNSVYVDITILDPEGNEYTNTSEVIDVEYSIQFDSSDFTKKGMVELMYSTYMPIHVSFYDPSTVYTVKDLRAFDLMALFPEDIVFTNCEIEDTNGRKAYIKDTFYQTEHIMRESITIDSKSYYSNYNLYIPTVSIIDIVEEYGEIHYSILYIVKTDSISVVKGISNITDYSSTIEEFELLDTHHLSTYTLSIQNIVYTVTETKDYYDSGDLYYVMVHTDYWDHSYEEVTEIYYTTNGTTTSYLHWIKQDSTTTYYNEAGEVITP